MLQENWPKYSDPFVRAGLFVLLNRYSDTGLVSSGEMSAENYSPTVTVNLKKAIPPQNLFLMLDQDTDFLNALDKIDTRCDYLILPLGDYKMSLLLQSDKVTHEDTVIDHERIFDFFSNTKNKTYLIYNYSTTVEKKYSGYRQYIVDKWGRLTESKTFAKEMIREALLKHPDMHYIQKFEKDESLYREQLHARRTHAEVLKQHRANLSKIKGFSILSEVMVDYFEMKQIADGQEAEVSAASCFDTSRQLTSHACMVLGTELQGRRQAEASRIQQHGLK